MYRLCTVFHVCFRYGYAQGLTHLMSKSVWKTSETQYQLVAYLPHVYNSNMTAAKRPPVRYSWSCLTNCTGITGAYASDDGVTFTIPAESLDPSVVSHANYHVQPLVATWRIVDL